METILTLKQPSSVRPFTLTIKTSVWSDTARCVELNLDCEEHEQTMTERLLRAAQRTMPSFPLPMPKGYEPKRLYGLSLNVKPASVQVFESLRDTPSAFEISLLFGTQEYLLQDCLVTGVSDSYNGIRIRGRSLIQREVCWTRLPLKPSESA